MNFSIPVRKFQPLFSHCKNMSFIFFSLFNQKISSTFLSLLKNVTHFSITVKNFINFSLTAQIFYPLFHG